MNVDARIRLQLGDLIVQNAALAAKVEELQAALAEATAKKEEKTDPASEKAEAEA